MKRISSLQTFIWSTILVLPQLVLFCNGQYQRKISIFSLKRDCILPWWLMWSLWFSIIPLPCYTTAGHLTQIKVHTRWQSAQEQGKLLLSIILQQHREFMTPKRWRFTVRDNWIITSFEGKRARTSFPWKINKLAVFKYLLVWADDQHAGTKTPLQKQNLCIQGAKWQCSYMSVQSFAVHLLSHFPKRPLFHLGNSHLCSLIFRHDGSG